VCVFVCVCGTVWNVFGGVSVQQVALWCVCVWDSLERVRGSECGPDGFVLYVCVCGESLERVLGYECGAGGFVVCVCLGQFGTGLGE